MEMASVRLARKLSERGHRVSFLADPDSQTARALRGSDAAVVPFISKGYVNPLAVRRIRRWFRQEGVDIIHSHYAKDLWTLTPSLGGSLHSVPLVLTKHIGTMQTKKDPLHRMVYGRVDHIIAVSEVIRKNILRTHPVSGEKVGLIPNGVDLSPFDPERPRRAVLRREFGIAEQPIVVGMAGRLNWWKGYREVLLAAESILRKRSDVWFLAVGGATLGEEAEAEAIRSFARTLDLKGRFIFTGFRNDMADCYSVMDLFVYPAYAEAFGLVLIEAMAAGLPVVSTDCDGVPEIVRHGVTGILVPARDAEPLVRAVESLLSDPENRNRYGRAGRIRAEKEYDFENVVSRTEDLYERLIGDGKGR